MRGWERDGITPVEDDKSNKTLGSVHLLRWAHVSVVDSHNSSGASIHLYVWNSGIELSKKARTAEMPTFLLFSLLSELHKPLGNSSGPDQSHSLVEFGHERFNICPLQNPLPEKVFRNSCSSEINEGL
ncbi:hypothetical protein CEXT_161901 [Caerostris extrusa]|uniref:Uncharacterized protein n=1 Tax=Caerostris extrusa TaxID=172846 RepID=A0AAV4VVA3_CAEEX|nr:hypothetical protein CEXT_161901 [Caerostris extrusa]